MSTVEVSPQRRDEIIDALRRGTVPEHGLGALAVGLDRFERALDEELARAAGGSGVFKAIRGEYGSGKTFLTRWLAERAQAAGMATSEVQISETETPLHRNQTIYRRLVERMATSTSPQGALREVLDSWLFNLESDVLDHGDVSDQDTDALAAATAALVDRRLGDVARRAQPFSAALRAYHRANVSGDAATAEGLLAWMSGQPSVAASIKRQAGVKGDLDHDGALSFLEALLVVLRNAGHPGLLLVLDEVETLQRVRSDTRDKGLNALRQLIDEVHGGRFPGLYLVITGTPAFFDAPGAGVQRLPPLAARLATDFDTDSRFDNPRAVQIRLRNFDFDSLVEVGVRIRDLYAARSEAPERIRARCDDAYLAELARAVAGKLGVDVGIVPRLFIKKLVADVLDRIDLYPDFDPRVEYQLTIVDSELTEVERNARAVSADDIDLELS